MTFLLLANKKGFDGTFGPLYSYGIKILKIHQPQWFLAENVGGLRSANEGKAFKKILQDMKDAGYKIYPHLYKFEDYGVPQARHRMIIVGIREDLPYEFKFLLRNPTKILITLARLPWNARQFRKMLAITSLQNNQPSC